MRRMMEVPVHLFGYIRSHNGHIPYYYGTRTQPVIRRRLSTTTTTTAGCSACLLRVVGHGITGREAER